METRLMATWVTKQDTEPYLTSKRDELCVRERERESHFRSDLQSVAESVAREDRAEAAAAQQGATAVLAGEGFLYCRTHTN